MAQKARSRGVVALALLLTGCAANTDDPDEVTLVFADLFTAKHPVGKNNFQPFLEHLEKKGPEVGLKINYFGGGALAPPSEILTLMRTGAVDIGGAFPSYLANELPLSGVAELPGLAEGSCPAANAIAPMVREGGVLYEEELKKHGVRGLSAFILPGYEIFTSQRKINGPDDVHGLMVRTPGGVADRVVDQLGAAPVQIGSSDLYESFARKIVAGGMIPRMSLMSYGLEDVVKYGTLGANLSTTTIILSIRPETWDKLDEKQRALVNEAAGIAQQGCAGLEADTAAATEKVREAGVELVDVSSQKAAWTSNFEKVRGNWVTDLESAGRDARRVLDTYQNNLQGAQS